MESSQIESNQAPAKKKRWMPVIIAIILGVFLFISVMINLMQGMTLMLKNAGGAMGDESDEFPMFTETTSWGAGDTKVVRIAIDGAIMRGGAPTLLGNTIDKVELVLEQVRAATVDEDVKAIILEVNSPGGGVTASDEIYQALQDFKSQQEGRKIVVYMKDLAASGGYYVAMAGDWLVAQPTSILGSIGVIMQSVNFHGFVEKHGISDTTIKSGENKDLMNPFQPVPEEQRELLQELIDAMYNRFSGLVAQGRSMDENKLKIFADGRVFDSDTALEHGFIDEIGYWQDVVEQTEKLLGQEEVHFVRYEKSVDFMQMLAGMKEPLEVDNGIEKVLRDPFSVSTPQLLYMWRP